MPNNFILDALTSPYNLSTPQDIEYARKAAYAKMGPIGRVGHWTQGLDHVLRAISGRMELNKIDEVNKGIGARQANAARALYETLNPSKPGNPIPQQQPTIAPVQNRNRENEEIPISSSDLWNNPEYVSRFIQIESGGNPAAVTGSYRGLGQFSRGEEKEFGINDSNWMDPQVQNDAILAVNKRNYDYFKSKMGREPTPTELYLTHQQGRGGVVAHLSNPDNPAYMNMLNTAEGQQRIKNDGLGSAEMWAKRAIAGNIPSDSPLKKIPVEQLTSGQFVNLWQNKFEGGGAAPVQVAQNTAAPIINDAAPTMPSPTNDIAPQEVSAAWGGQTGALPPQAAGGAPAQLPVQSPAPAAIPASAPQVSNIQPQGMTPQQDIPRQGTPPVNLPNLPFSAPQMSPQIMQVLSDPFVDPDFKNTIMQEMIKRTQPIKVDFGDGGTGFWDPKTQKWHNPPKLNKSMLEVGGVKTPVYDAASLLGGIRRIQKEGTNTPNQAGRFGITADGKPATRIGEVPLDENWDIDTLSRANADRELMKTEREEDVKGRAGVLTGEGGPVKQALTNANIARDSLDLVKKWRASLTVPGANKVISGTGAKLGYDAVRTYNEIARRFDLPLYDKGEVTAAQLRNALGVQMAANLARRADPNPTVRQFEALLATTPGLLTDENTGNAMVKFIEQLANRDLKVAELASKGNIFDFIENVKKIDDDFQLELPEFGEPELRGTVTPPPVTQEEIDSELRTYDPVRGWVID